MKTDFCVVGGNALGRSPIVISLTEKIVSLADDGVFLITIRPREYWQVHGEAVADRMMAKHDETGFAFLPSNRPPIDGDVTYRDTSISVEYIAANFPRWQVVSQHCNLIDPYQLLLFLRPA